MGDNKATATPWVVGDTDTYIVYGALDNLWGTSWSYSDINNNGFGVELFVNYTGSFDVDARIDHINITVYYTEAGSPQQ
ncbi:hypothetical protein LCGC14_1884020, partial [marine sediment metagenome]